MTDESPSNLDPLRGRFLRAALFIAVIAVGVVVYESVSPDVGHGLGDARADRGIESAEPGGDEPKPVWRLFGREALGSGDSALGEFTKLTLGFFASLAMIGGALGLLVSAVELVLALLARLPDRMRVSALLGSWARKAESIVRKRLKTDQGLLEADVGRLAVAAVTAIAVAVSFSVTVRLDRQTVGLEPEDAQLIRQQFGDLKGQVASLTGEIREASRGNAVLTNALASLDLPGLELALVALDERMASWDPAQIRPALVEVSREVEALENTIGTASQRIGSASEAMGSVGKKLDDTTELLSNVDAKLKQELTFDGGMHKSLKYMEQAQRNDESRNLLERMWRSIAGAEKQDAPRDYAGSVAAPPPDSPSRRVGK